MEQKQKRILFFVPLILAAAGILFLLGTVLTYSIKYVPVGANEAVKEYFDVHLWDTFNASLTPSWPIICIISLLTWAGIAPILGMFTKGKNRENYAISSSFCFLFAICFLTAYKELFSYFGASLIENFHSASVGWGSALSILMATFGVFVSLATSGKEFDKSIRGVAEDGILIALAFVLNFVKLPISAGAGSINLQMLPLFLIALRRGPLHGFISGGVVYGMLTCLTDGYGFYTYPFDYLIGFGSVAIMGFFSKVILFRENKVDSSWGAYSIKGECFLLLGGILSTFVRFIGSTTSSMVIYGYNFVTACGYNAIYIPVSGALAIAILMVLYGPIRRINVMFPVEENGR